MGRFYERRVVEDEGGAHYLITIARRDGYPVDH